MQNSRRKVQLATSITWVLLAVLAVTATVRAQAGLSAEVGFGSVVGVRFQAPEVGFGTFVGVRLQAPEVGFGTVVGVRYECPDPR